MGQFGSVHSALNLKTGEIVAIKKMEKKKNESVNIQREVNVLEHLLGHCNKSILCYRGFLEDRSNWYIISEFLDGYRTLQFLNIDEYHHIQILFQNIISGLKLIHQLGVSHGDIKPQNIMFNPETFDIKYLDFGVSCQSDDLCLSEVIVGTPDYMSPEFLDHIVNKKKRKFGLLDRQKADLWALGILFFQLTTGYVPYIYWLLILKSYDVKKYQEALRQEKNSSTISEYLYRSMNEWMDILQKKISKGGQLDNQFPYLHFYSLLEKDPSKRNF
jgi:serine/threonine protein kinase